VRAWLGILENPSLGLGQGFGEYFGQWVENYSKAFKNTFRQFQKNTLIRCCHIWQSCFPNELNFMCRLYNRNIVIVLSMNGMINYISVVGFQLFLVVTLCQPKALVFGLA
jgi:hypothetical protein